LNSNLENNKQTKEISYWAWNLMMGLVILANTNLKYRL